jgi:arsenite oxidase small subunit
LSATTDGARRGYSRRELLAAGAVGGIAVGGEVATTEAATRAYPEARIAALGELRVNRALRFSYPLRTQQSVLLDMGSEVPAGVGPKKSIVAFSVLCQHMGCDVGYDRGERAFVCPCHQTRYDPERLGAIIQGVATRALPRVLLEVRGSDIYAVGVDGLIYGYRTNLAPGRKVGAAS